jgi:branched-chain amino acid transport system substrate-binding protein
MNKKMTVVLAAGALLAAGPALAQGSKVRGVTKNEIVLGMHTDLSGPAAAYGVSSRNAAQMRFDEVNAAGGVHGRKIKLIVEDNQYQVPRAVQAGNKLLNRDNVFAMVGALGTPMNNAVLPEQLKMNVPNLFPITAARQMHLPLHPLKFALFATYYDQIRSGMKHMVQNMGKKAPCVMYQDTDFGQEIFEAARDQAQAMNLKIVETATHKPTDTDFSPQIAKLRQANCDLILMGTIIRDTIIPYGTARKAGWNEVTFLGSTASYDYPVAAAPGGATEGFYSMGTTDLPYRDTAKGAVLADITVVALDRAGPNLTVESLTKALEGIQGYRDIFGGPVLSFGPQQHQGTQRSPIYVVKGGRYVPVTEPLMF